MNLVSDTVAVEAVGDSRKRLRRTPEEKRRIVEATFVPPYFRMRMMQAK
jgi:hypothetical protein